VHQQPVMLGSGSKRAGPVVRRNEGGRDDATRE
jgi:hypothetical protein